jgi:hemerythrin-like domain-containing protein
MIVCSSKPESEEAIPITEDLMREHGILNRTLLIYEEIIQRISKNKPFQTEDLLSAIDIIRSFVEDYHEKIEETYIFPLFEKNKKKVSLVRTLKKQHDKGRVLTTELKKLASRKLDARTKKKIKSVLQQFIRMYRPHEARENTVLFPDVRSLVSEAEFKRLSTLSDDLEHQIFGGDGFDIMLEKVARIEKNLGIYALDQFTPR